MPIAIACQQCGRKYNVTSQLAGKLVRCKGCHENFRVPVPVFSPKSNQKLAERTSVDIEVPDEIEESVAASPALETHSVNRSSMPDLGGSRVFQVVLLLVALGLVYQALQGSEAAEVALPVGLGIFAMISALSGWESFRKSWRNRLVASIVNEDASRGVNALIGIALIALGALVATGLIPSLHATPLPSEAAVQAPAPTQDEPIQAESPKTPAEPIGP